MLNACLIYAFSYMMMIPCLACLLVYHVLLHVPIMPYIHVYDTCLLYDTCLVNLWSMLLSLFMLLLMIHVYYLVI